jgi:hypothetical protein
MPAQMSQADTLSTPNAGDPRRQLPRHGWSRGTECVSASTPRTQTQTRILGRCVQGRCGTGARCAHRPPTRRGRRRRGPLVTRAAPVAPPPNPMGHFRELPRCSGDPRGEPPVARRRRAALISARPGGSTVKGPAHPLSLLLFHSILSPPPTTSPCTLV